VDAARAGAHPQRDAVALPAIQRAVETETAIGLHALEARGARYRGAGRALGYYLEGALGPDLEARLQSDALAVFARLGCRDFARVDFRVDEAGTPYFLEINPLPTFAPDGTFAIVAELLGQPYDAFLADVLRRALAARGLA
jgi:D-alanine-D-alanine ligase